MDRRIAHVLLNGGYTLLGEPVRRYLEEFERTQWLSKAQLEEHRVRRLREVLGIAWSQSPYYGRLLGEAGVRDEGSADLDVLARLPTLSRDEVRSNWADLIGAGPRGRREARRTSGSTGLPLKIEKSRSTTGAMNGLMWRNYAWFGIRMGDRQARIWSEPRPPLRLLRSRASDFLQNRIRLSSSSLGPEHFDRFIDRLLSFRPRYMYGYGQSLYRLAEYADSSNRDLGRLGLAAVISTAEAVSDAQLELVNRVFDAPVVNEYGCTEVGVIAIDCPAGTMHVMDDGLIVEIVRDGRRAEPGEEGEILVTELYGSVAPLIRYRTGDRGVFSSAACECGRQLQSIERLSGRVTELIRRPDGTLIDPDVFDPLLKARPEMYLAVKQWRVRQQDASRVRVTLCTEDARARPDIESYLMGEWDALTGAQLELVFEYEEWLKPKASGKTL